MPGQALERPAREQWRIAFRNQNHAAGVRVDECRGGELCGRELLAMQQHVIAERIARARGIQVEDPEQRVLVHERHDLRPAVQHRCEERHAFAYVTYRDQHRRWSRHLAEDEPRILLIPRMREACRRAGNGWCRDVPCGIAHDCVAEPTIADDDGGERVSGAGRDVAERCGGRDLERHCPPGREQAGAAQRIEDHGSRRAASLLPRKQ